jgi:hypothetical protein
VQAGDSTQRNNLVTSQNDVLNQSGPGVSVRTGGFVPRRSSSLVEQALHACLRTTVHLCSFAACIESESLLHAGYKLAIAHKNSTGQLASRRAKWHTNPDSKTLPRQQDCSHSRDEVMALLLGMWICNWGVPVDALSVVASGMLQHIVRLNQAWVGLLQS